MLTDWPFEDLNSMKDVTQKYSGRGSYWEPIAPILSSFMQNYTTLDRHSVFLVLICLNMPLLTIVPFLG